MKKKISKYKDLEIEIENIRHFKTTTVPVLEGGQDMFKEGTDKYINMIYGSPNLYKIQKVIALYGTDHLLQSVL